MTERLQTILKELDSGTRDSLYNEIFSVEELLSKDDNGATFLDIILKKGLSLNRLTEENIKHNIEIAYIYCNNNESIDFFELSEEDLFKKYSGSPRTYFEYFLFKNLYEKGYLPSQMISVVEKHLKIIDILVEYCEDYRCFEKINPKLIELITTKKSEGTYIIEKYMGNQELMDVLISLIDNPTVIIELGEKYPDNNLLKKPGEKALLNNAPNGEVFLLYLINKKGIIPEELEVLSSVNIEFLSFIIKNNLYDYIIELSTEVCLQKVEGDKTFLENFIDNASKNTLARIRLVGLINKDILIILKNKNRLNLVEEIDDATLLEPVCDVLQMEEVDKSITLLEYMLDNGYNPLEGKLSISNEEILKILYKKQRPDLLLKVSEKYLFKNIENDITYFDYILDCVKEEKIKVRLRDLCPYSNEPDLLISYYFSIAKKNMMKYIAALTERDVLEKFGDVTLLELMLEKDSDLTLNKVLSNYLKSNINIAIILKSKGFEQKEVNILSPKEKYADNEELDRVQNHLGIGPLLKEGEILLSQLEQLFLSDGRSDKDLIKALVSGYRQSLFVNYELNIKEIKNLIYVKRQNKNTFFYIRDEKKSCFSQFYSSVYCDTISTNALLHETGHALHYFLTNNREPENYQEVIINARNNPEVLKRVEQYSKQYHEIKKKIIELVEQRCKDFFEGYYTEERKQEIRTFLSEEITIKKEKFGNLGLSEGQLEEILGEIYTEEEYIGQQKRIFINENCETIMRSEYEELRSIGDIIDAIYEGRFFSGKLINQHGDKIKGTCGHGLVYYYETEYGFAEMIANFASISKSKDSEKMLELLRTIVGDELYNMLSEFYYQNIVNINVDEMETGRTIGGK